MRELRAMLITAGQGVTRQALSRGVKAKRLTRLFSGVYVKADGFAALGFADQYRLKALAYLATHPKAAAWGITAAALDGAPVLQGAKLHFQYSGLANQPRLQGIVIHRSLGATAADARREARIIYESAVSSPLVETLLVANYYLRKQLLEAKGSYHYAAHAIDDKTTEALVRLPIDAAQLIPLRAPANVRRLALQSDAFTERYWQMRQTDISSAQAELLWFEYANLCALPGRRRGCRIALRAGLYFSDLPESPAESLLVGRCAELGFDLPYLQVNIHHPANGQLLGRVDGLWPTPQTHRQLRYTDTRHGRRLFVSANGDGNSVVIEFDGRIKYDEDYAKTLEKERLRQNAIANIGYRFVRIGWPDLMNPSRLKAILDSAALPSQQHAA